MINYSILGVGGGGTGGVADMEKMTKAAKIIVLFHVLLKVS